MTYLLQTLLSVGQLILGCYGFWLVWQVLLAELPGPRDPHDRIAPYAGYFTGPLVQPVARRLPVRPHVVSGLLLLLLAAGEAALRHLSAAL